MYADQDHVRRIREGIAVPGGICADLCSGSGAFPQALADQPGPGARIYSIDTDRRALRNQALALHAKFPGVNVEYLEADFTRKMALPPLDRILMANSLYYVRHKGPVLDLIRSYLRPAGHLLLVEYDAEHGNIWVPFPLTYVAWEALVRQHGFTHICLPTTVPSRFLREIDAALSVAA